MPTMKSCRLAYTAALGALSFALSSHVSAGPSVYPDGTTRYDKTRAFENYVLFTSGDSVAHLISRRL